MSSRKLTIPQIQAGIAAILFGISAPFAKMLLRNIQPVCLAGFLYLGSGVGLLATMLLLRVLQKTRTEAPVTRRDLPKIIGAMLTGGIAAPIILMFSLQRTPAATASLLLNFEAVATALIAALMFKEAIGKKIWLSIGCITAGGIILSVDTSGAWGISVGELGVLAACVLWGTDNNITNTISAKDPLAIVTIKALGAGTFSILLAIALKNPLPHFGATIAALIVGYFTYGLSIVLFVLAMRGLGAARAGTVFGTAPFVGAAVSFIMFRALPGWQFLLSLPIFIFGAVLLLTEEHSHDHLHSSVVHEHCHTHDDGHHDHKHDGEVTQANESHSHLHKHRDFRHSHRHTPDIHHRHEHQA